MFPTREERAAMAKAWRSKVPEGRRGPYVVERFEIEHGFGWLHYALQGREPGPPGTYTRLMRDSTIVMSDTDAELRDHLEFLSRAHGRVLIHGLGLGCALAAILTRECVTAVDVVERDPDVLALVAPHFADPRVTFHEGDALTFRFPAGVRWNVAWHDIWDTITLNNRPEMIRLHRRYGRRVEWQASWARRYVEA